MKKHLKRFGEEIIVCVISFIILAVINKLLFKEENWLYESACCAIVYSIGSYISPFLTSATEGIKSNIILRLGLIALLFFIVAFILGVLFNMTTWLEHTMFITFVFGFSIITSAFRK